VSAIIPSNNFFMGNLLGEITGRPSRIRWFNAARARLRPCRGKKMRRKGSVNDRHLHEVVSLILLLYSYDLEILNVPQLCGLFSGRRWDGTNALFDALILGRPVTACCRLATR
jgi:hypothetical protein